MGQLEKLEEQLKEEIEQNGITQAQIFEEMSDREKAVLSNVVGMPYVQAFLNRLGVPGGEREVDEG